MGIAFHVPKAFRGSDLEKFKEKNALEIEAMKDSKPAKASKAPALTKAQKQIQKNTREFYTNFVAEKYQTATPIKSFFTKEIKTFEDEIKEYKAALQRPGCMYLGQKISPEKVENLEIERDVLIQLRTEAETLAELNV